MTKTTKPTVRFHNIDTNEVIDREMNSAEFAQYEADQAKFAAEAAETQAKAQAKTELLERLGITEDEAKLFLS